MLLATHKIALPAFVSAADLARDLARAMRPPQAISVSECAEKHRRLNNPGAYVGPWRNAMRPWLVEIMDRTTSRAVDTIVFIGPAQTSGKTEVPLNVLGHRAKYRPADILIFQPTKDLADDFSKRRVDLKTFRCSPDFASELGDARGDDNVHMKVFRNGTSVSIAWPTGSQLASRPVPEIYIDERDSMADDIGGEGPPEKLGRARTVTFGKNAKVYISSSPKRLDYSGIRPLYDQGDRNLWHVPCPHCGEHFTPGFDKSRKPTLAHLFIPDGATPEIARREARLICPNCGAAIVEQDRPAMKARGRWAPAGCTVNAAGELEGTRSANTTASYWLHGFCTDKPLADLAGEYVEAVKKFEEHGDEGPLKSWFQTVAGVDYKPKHLDAAALDVEAIAARADEFPVGVVPAAARFVTAAVDVQGNRFEVLIVAWLAMGQARLVDRFSIFKTTDADTGQERLIDPSNRAADWDLLIARVVDREFPIEHAGDEAPKTVKPLRTAIDTGGKAGVTGLAYDFWLRARAKDRENRRRILLIKGGSNEKAPLVSPSLIEHDARSGKKLRVGIRLNLLNVDALKDMANSRLRVADASKAGFVYVPRGLAIETIDGVPQVSAALKELASEVKIAGKGWLRLPDRPRNESWDLFVYCLASFVLRGGMRIDWTNPPAWAAMLGAPIAREASPAAEAPRGAAQAPAPSVVSSPTAPRATRSKKLPPWMIRKGRGGFVTRYR